MKKIAALFIVTIFVPFLSYAQIIEGADFISPPNDGVVAVKKGNQWAFVNEEGAVVIDFRDDLVSTKTHEGDYPIFKNNRCLILQKMDGISYFGYIDKSGKMVIKPRFLNARNFYNDVAFAIELEKTELGKNDILGKPIVSYDYFEVLIDDQGEVLHYLSKPYHITLSKKHLRNPPIITSKFISDNLISTMNKDKKWSINKMN